MTGALVSSGNDWSLQPTRVHSSISTSTCLHLADASFHSHLSPFLFGYRLQFRHFPYLPDGPKTMTPFILAVLCLASSERLPGYTHLRAKLETEVLDMIESSPAESWLTFASAKAVAIEPPAVKMGEDALDPELGIGPEEIVGASILATFWSGSPGQCIHIARCAFRWARGWIKVGASRWTRAALKVPVIERSGSVDVCGSCRDGSA